MGRGPRRQDYSSLKTAGRGPGTLTTPIHPSTPPPHPPSHRALGDQQVDPWTKEGGEEGGGIIWVTAGSQLIERPLGR